MNAAAVDRSALVESGVLVPSAAGVLRWLTQAQGSSVQRLLIEHLALRRVQLPLDMRALSSALNRPAQDLARALFGLHHARELSVEPSDASVEVGCTQDLGVLLSGLLKRPGCAVLANQAGVCLAAIGWSGAAAEHAARLASAAAPTSPNCVRFFFGRGTVSVGANVPFEDGAPHWVALARQLLSTDGALGVARAHADETMG